MNLQKVVGIQGEKNTELRSAIRSVCWYLTFRFHGDREESRENIKFTALQLQGILPIAEIGALPFKNIILLKQWASWVAVLPKWLLKSQAFERGFSTFRYRQNDVRHFVSKMFFLFSFAVPRYTPTPPRKKRNHTRRSMFCMLKSHCTSKIYLQSFLLIPKWIVADAVETNSKIRNKWKISRH